MGGLIISSVNIFIHSVILSQGSCTMKLNSTTEMMVRIETLKQFQLIGFAQVSTAVSRFALRPLAQLGSRRP